MSHNYAYKYVCFGVEFFYWPDSYEMRNIFRVISAYTLIFPILDFALQPATFTVNGIRHKYNRQPDYTRNSDLFESEMDNIHV